MSFIQNKKTSCINLLLGFVCAACILFLIPPLQLGLIHFLEKLSGRTVNHPEVVSLYFTTFFLVVLYTFSAIAVYVNVNDEKLLKKIFICFFVLFAIAGMYAIIRKAAWIIGDDDEYLCTVALGKFKPFNLWGKRFFWHAEYNLVLLTPFYREAVSYYIINAVEFAVTVFYAAKILFFFFEKFSLSKAGKIFAFTYTICSFLIATKIYLSPIYPEKLLILFLLMLIYYLFKAFKTDRTLYFVLSGIIAFCATYNKEPVFVTLIIIASVILICESHFVLGKTQEEKNGGLILNKRRLFSAWIFVNGIIFCVLYYIFSLSRSKGGAAYSLARTETFNVLTDIILQYPVATGIVIFTACRAVLFLIKRNTLCLEDGFLLAGAAYYCAFVILKMPREYYFYPCYFFALPSVIKLCENVQEKKSIHNIRNAVFAALTIFVLSYSIYNSVNRIDYHYRDMETDNRCMDEVVRYYNSGWKIYYAPNAGAVVIFMNYLEQNANAELTDVLPETLNENEVIVSRKHLKQYENDAFTMHDFMTVFFYEGK